MTDFFFLSHFWMRMGLFNLETLTKAVHSSVQESVTAIVLSIMIYHIFIEYIAPANKNTDSAKTKSFHLKDTINYQT